MPRRLIERSAVATESGSALERESEGEGEPDDVGYLQSIPRIKNAHASTDYDYADFTEQVMADDREEDLLDVSAVGKDIRERLIDLSKNHTKRLGMHHKTQSGKDIENRSMPRVSDAIHKNGIQSLKQNRRSDLYLDRSKIATKLRNDIDEKARIISSNIVKEGIQREQVRHGSLVDAEEPVESGAKVHSGVAPLEVLNIFSPAMIESFLHQEHPYPDAQDVEIELIDCIEFSLDENSELIMEKKSVPLSMLKDGLVEHAKGIENENKSRSKKETNMALSAIPLGVRETESGFVDEEGRLLYRSRLEINTFPLAMRLKAISEAELESLRVRLGLYKVTVEGLLVHGHTCFINFDGFSEYDCDLAAQEVTSTMESDVPDEAQQVDLHDIMQLLLALGGTSKPMTSNARHCVLMGLYPIQCVLLNDKLVLIESKSLAKTDNQILETTAKVVANAIKYRITAKRELRAQVHFDHVCYEAVFMTIWRIHSNALEAMQNRALICHRVYNVKAYVSLEDQKQMYMVKMQVSKLRDTLAAMCECFQEILGKDVTMAFMNLSVLKQNDSLYRMTVDKKKTLSAFDDRITCASHDIELILYAHFLRYAKLLKQAEHLATMLNSVEEWQTLQSLNTQTKVLVANTYMTVLGCTIAFGGAVTGAFGMNLDNAYVEWPNYAFYTVCAITLVFILLGTQLTIYALKRNGVIPN